MKQCSMCRETKEFSEFYKNKNLKDGINCWCKKCHSEKAKQWYQKNKKHCDENRKKYRQKNPEYQKKWMKNWKTKNYKHYSEYRKKWRKNNPQYSKNYRNKNILKIKTYKKEWQKEKRKNPKNRLTFGMSRTINMCLKGWKRGRKWETLVGYTLQDLIQHLEKQFDDKTNWQNYGSYWHLDHIVPKSWFPYQTAEEQAFKDCWALANLQPLEAKANLSKNNYYLSL